jgi:hypothetical protein
MLKHPGVRFVTLEDMAADFRKRFPRKATAGKGKKGK